MKIKYDQYYQTQNLFGAPYPALLNFYTSLPKKGKLLDIGCGQGRDAIALAKLGFEVTGIDYSKVGIAQLQEIAQKENLSIEGIVVNIYKYANFDDYEFILLDSMFHFGKKEKIKEIKLLEKIFTLVKTDALVTICIQDTGHKLEVLHSVISEFPNLTIMHQEAFKYRFEDHHSNHSSETNYQMITVKKLSRSPHNTQ